MTLMEAMAAGCPVLVHDLPGPRELCQNGTAGALLPTLDPAAWADEIRRLLLHRAIAPATRWEGAPRRPSGPSSGR